MPFKKGHTSNPTGKGGFGDNPQNRSDGGWSKETSIPYLMQKFGRMPIDELMKYTPKTGFEQIAYNSLQEAFKDLHHQKEVTDRTAGKAKENKDLNIKADIVIDMGEWQ